MGLEKNIKVEASAYSMKEKMAKEKSFGKDKGIGY